jgi:hypothetical protein
VTPALIAFEFWQRSGGGVTDDGGFPADEAWRRPAGDGAGQGGAGGRSDAGERPAPPLPTFRRPADPPDGAPNPWRRPPDEQRAGTSPSGRTPGPPDPYGVSPPYAGPPPTQAPPRGWRPPTVVRSPDPRDLPAQDLDAISRDERAARTLTLGVGMIAGAVALIVTCLLCSRVLF